MISRNQLKRRIAAGLDYLPRPAADVLRLASSVRNPQVPARLATAHHLERRGLLRFATVIGRTESCYPAPQVLGTDKGLSEKFKGRTWEAVGIMEVPEGRISTRHGLPLAADNTLIIDGTINFNSKSSALFFDIYRDHDDGIGSVRSISGTTLNLASAWACVNYAHFLLESLSRVHLIEQAGYTWDDFDAIVLPEYRTNSINRIIAWLGLPHHKVTPISRRELIKCERLIQPSHPCANQMRNYPHWVPDFLRTKAGMRDSVKARRLFLTRSGSQRSLREEGEVIELLQDSGFEIVDPASPGFELEWLAEAECVLGIHGAGLANVAFCKPHSTLIEIIPCDWQFPYYYSLACGNQMNYFALLGGRVGMDGKFSIDVRKLSELIKRAGL